MKQKIFLSVLSGLLFIFGAAAQNTISGTVTNDDGVALPGVNVAVQGTTTGTQTDFDGVYTLNAASGSVLVFSYLGFKPQEITVGNSTTIDVQLLTDAAELDAVVVTAFGVRKEAKKLGYLVQQVDAETLTEAANPNVATSLQGKLSGVQITPGSNGPGSSTNITIRGINSLSGNNQPLYVIDGVLVNNTNLSTTQFNGGGDFAGGLDFGDGLSNLNPYDIETVSVLKGGNATALYGFQGINGVIVITTKKGRSSKPRVEINSSVSFENVLIAPKLQNQYGQGTFNTATNELEYRTNISTSWGPLLDNSQRERFDGVGTAAYSASPGDFKDFYQTGVTKLNAISISQAKDGFNYKLSYAFYENGAVQPGIALRRNNVSFLGGISVTDNLKVSAKIDYTSQFGRNRPELTDGQSNTVKSLSLKPRNLSNALLSANYLSEDGSPNNWQGSFIMNPYYTARTKINQDQTDRYIGLVSIEYSPFEGFDITARASQDQSFISASIFREQGAFDIAPNGKLDEYNTKSRLNTYDLLLEYNRDLGEDFSLGITAGLNRQDNIVRSIVNSGETFVQPNIFSFNNFVSKNIVPALGRSRSNAVFGALNLGYKDFAFVEVTGRNDWSSTLAIENASFFYPSIGGSLVLTEAIEGLKENKMLSFLRLRGNFAKTGNATVAYALNDTYYVSSAPYNGLPFYFYGQNEEGAGAGPALRNPNLEAEISSSYEIGLDARFLNDRVTFDATYYSTRTSNQILQLSLPTSSGANSQFINAGLITNKGIELGLSADIIKSENFNWNTTLNFTKNVNKIEELAQDIDVQLRASQFNGIIQVGAQLGQPLQTLFGPTFTRDEGDNIVYDADGLPIIGGIGRIGNTNPDALANMLNTFNYKNVSLTVLLDARFGGDVFSFSDALRAGAGTDEVTLAGREYFTGGQGIPVPEGAVVEGTLNPDVVARGVNPQLYWSRVSQISENFVQDASFIKLREVTLGYAFNKNVLDKLSLSQLRISYIGRNLAILHKNTKNFDPETGFNTDFSGVEYFGFPSTSSHGLKVSLAF